MRCNMSRKSKALEFVDEMYNMSVTGRNIEVTEPIRDYIMEKISKIERFTHRIIDVNVILDIQKLDKRVEVILKAENIKVRSQAISTDMYASIDKAVDKIEAQLRRYKTKLKDHQVRGTKSVDMNVEVLRGSRDAYLEDVNEEIERVNEEKKLNKYHPHELVKQEKRPLKTLTYDEAVMKMELSQDFFLVFRHEEDMKIKVIYRRNDGDYGIIKPEA